MAYKLVKTEGGKTNWAYLRHIGYTLLIVWAVGVRLMHVDPFDDIMRGEITIGTLMDILVLYALWLFVWLVLYPMRPRFNAASTT